MEIRLNTTAETEQLGASLYKVPTTKALIFLQGDLGVGKTTLVRGYLRAAGYYDTVKSPTYNIVEEYTLAGTKLYHFDLYRLNDPEELEWMGISDYFSEDTVCFIEWPERGVGFLPKPDLMINLSVQGNGRLAKMIQL